MAKSKHKPSRPGATSAATGPPMPVRPPATPRKSPADAGVEPKSAPHPAGPRFAASPTSATASSISPAPGRPEPKFGFLSYLAVNATFAAFCLLQYVVVRTTMSETKGLVFFFVLLVAAFAAASAFDALHGRDADGDDA